MRFNINIHNRNHVLKNILGNLEHIITTVKLNKNELTVVNYHGTQKKFLANFETQLRYFKNRFHIISPEMLPVFFSGELKHIEKSLLLITFDDGIQNNLYAAEILNKHNIKAYFFIIPDFINFPSKNQNEYFLKHIRPIINKHIDSESEDFKAISWIDIKKLLNAGHAVGSHTQTHTLVAEKSSIENSVIEIKESKLTIASNLNLPIEAVNTFCSINNTLESVSIKELKLIKENYQYHFTTIPGRNLTTGSPYFIKRANIESYWLKGAVKYAIGKWSLKRWLEKSNAYLKNLNS